MAQNPNLIEKGMVDIKDEEYEKLKDVPKSYTAELLRKAKRNKES